MSVNSLQTNINQDKYFFLLADVSTITVNTLFAKSISTNILTGGEVDVSTVNAFQISTFFLNTDSISSQNLEANYSFVSSQEVLDGRISSLTTNNIVLDGNYIDTGGAGFGAVLLLNGLPIATGNSTLSSIADWAFFPALSTLNMNTYDIINARNLNSQNIFNALNVQTDTLSALTSITSPAATITNGRFTSLSSVNTNLSNAFVQTLLSTTSINASNITNAGLINSSRISTAQLDARNVIARGLSSLTLSTGTINGVPYTTGSNWSQYPATSAVNFNGNALTNTTGQTFSIAPTSNLTITTSNGNLVANYPITVTGGDITLTANGGSDVGNNATVNIVASNGNRGQINLTANPGFAGVQGEVNVTANGGSAGGVGFGGLITLTANTPIGLSNLTSAIKFSAAGVNSYAGAIPSIGSLAGYNFIYGTLGVNVCAGLPAGALPNAGGTVYLYGTTGVEVPSDAYMKYINPYWDGVTTPPDLRIEGRYITPNLAQVCVRMSNVRQIDFQSNVTTYMSNCDNIAMSANGIITTSNLTTNNINTTTINSLAMSNYLNTSNFTTASISSATISSINNFASFGSKSMRIEGDVAQIQLSNNNPAGNGTILNLLSRVQQSEIQSFNSNFTTPLPLFLNASYTSTPAINVSTINGQKLPYPYGSFTVNASQTIGVANTAVSTIFDTTEYANGISIVNSTSPLLAVSTSGLYRWIASPQFNTTSGGANPVSFWFLKNGGPIARSASKATVANNATLFSAVEIYEQMNAGDTLSFCFTSSDTNMSLAYFPASGVVPANPALILNGNKIADI